MAKPAPTPKPTEENLIATLQATLNAVRQKTDALEAEDTALQCATDAMHAEIWKRCITLIATIQPHLGLLHRLVMLNGWRAEQWARVDGLSQRGKAFFNDDGAFLEFRLTEVQSSDIVRWTQIQIRRDGPVVAFHNPGLTMSEEGVPIDLWGEPPIEPQLDTKTILFFYFSLVEGIACVLQTASIGVTSIEGELSAKRHLIGLVDKVNATVSEKLDLIRKRLI
jgi:hypothetical protein